MIDVFARLEDMKYAIKNGKFYDEQISWHNLNIDYKLIKKSLIKEVNNFNLYLTFYVFLETNLFHDNDFEIEYCIPIVHNKKDGVEQIDVKLQDITHKVFGCGLYQYENEVDKDGYALVNIKSDDKDKIDIISLLPNIKDRIKNVESKIKKMISEFVFDVERLEY